MRYTIERATGDHNNNDIREVIDTRAKRPDHRVLCRATAGHARRIADAMNASDHAMRLVVLESPFTGDTTANSVYARACVRDSLLRGEAPIAPHLLYTQEGILDDTIPSEREHGIAAGLAWLAVADASVVCVDKGVSQGMEQGVSAALQLGIPVERRTIKS